MRLFIVFMLFLQYSWAQAFNQKIILSAMRDTQQAQKVWEETENYFSAHTHMNKFLSQHNIAIKLEKLDPYFLITLSPILNAKEKQELFYVLHKKFSHMFTVNNTFSAMISFNQTMKEKVKTEYPSQPKKRLSIKSEQISSFSFQKWWKNINKEWIALLLLALAGFFLIFRSARQISKIKDLQNEVAQYQKTLGNEMQNMENKDV